MGGASFPHLSNIYPIFNQYLLLYHVTEGYINTVCCRKVFVSVTQEGIGFGTPLPNIPKFNAVYCL